MIPPKASSAPRPIVGILWMIFTGFNFVAVTVLVRQLGTDLPAAQSAFLRFAIGALFFAPSLLGLVRGGPSRQALRVFFARGTVHACAVVLWFYAMARIPVAEVTAIGYLNPVLVTLGATVFFKEKLTRTHYLAIGLAFVGTLIILRPGFRNLGLGQMAQVGAAILFGCSYLLAKKLSQSQSAGQIVVMLSFCVTVGLAPLAFWVWVPPSLWQFFSLALVALFATLGHFSMTRAFQAAPMAVTQPVVFLQLIWASLFGYILFDELPDVFVVLGGFIIVAAVSYIVWRNPLQEKKL